MRGGTKIHAACDALGNPIRFILTCGEVFGYIQAIPLLDGVKAKVIIPNKTPDVDYIVAEIVKMEGEVVIP